MKGEKVDLIKLHKAEYSANAQPKIIVVKKAFFLAFDGRGIPGSEEFQAAITALYGMAYTVKMVRKSEGKGDYTIGKLEALYWADEDRELDPQKKAYWNWQLLIRTPEAVDGFAITAKDLQIARSRLQERKKGEGTEKVHLVHLEEGRCVQILHLGPYDQQDDSLHQIREFCQTNQLIIKGPHHEIYISDPRRTPPERLKTILRLSLA